MELISLFKSGGLYKKPAEATWNLRTIRLKTEEDDVIQILFKKW
jgi:hypothetical protein